MRVLFDLYQTGDSTAIYKKETVTLGVASNIQSSKKGPTTEIIIRQGRAELAPCTGRLVGHLSRHWHFQQ
jgi:hypothetical protein